MASVDYSVTDELPQKSVGRVQPDIADLVGIARRGWFYIVAGAIIGLLAAYAVLSNLSPVYKASSRIAFERTLSRYLQSNKITNEPLIDDYGYPGADLRDLLREHRAAGRQGAVFDERP